MGLMILGAFPVPAVAPSMVEEVPRTDLHWTQYHRYDNITQQLRDLDSRYPDLVKLESMGKSWHQRDLWVLKISDMADMDDPEEPDVLVVGPHHGNEYIGVEVVWLVINYLLENYQVDPRVTWLVDNREIWVVPFMNPDAHDYNFESGQSFRKNLRDNDGDMATVRDNSFGVDLNRNYPFHWDSLHDGDITGGNSRFSRRSSMYAGPKDNYDDDGDSILTFINRGLRVDEDWVDNLDNDGDGLVDEDPDGGFSEPETRALRDLIQRDPYRNNINFTVYVDFHSYSGLVLYPWGYTSQPCADAETLQLIGERMAELSNYTAMQGYDLYQTNGDSLDWIYGKEGILCYTVEIGKEQHVPPPEEIPYHTWNNLGSTLYLAEVAKDPRGVTEASQQWLAPEPYDGWNAQVRVSTMVPPEQLKEGAVSVHYRVGDGPYSTIKMYRGPDGYYSTSIYPDQKGTMEYFFTAETLSGNQLSYPGPVETIDVEVTSEFVSSQGISMGLLALSMLFFLGLIWGGFAFTVQMAIRADRKKKAAGVI